MTSPRALIPCAVTIGLWLLLGAPTNGLALATVVGVVGLMTLGLIENSPKGH